MLNVFLPARLVSITYYVRAWTIVIGVRLITTEKEKDMDNILASGFEYMERVYTGFHFMN